MDLELVASEDSALCGGASFSPDAPILAVDGLIWAPDGLCKPYAEGAKGTTNADGGGLLLLQGGGEGGGEGALLGAAANNDGGRKSSFSAPSYEGQVEVIRQAQRDAQLLGGPVEILGWGSVQCIEACSVLSCVVDMTYNV